MVKDSNTEQRIIEAARRVFLEKGMAGARMQEIADEAGINKALLHYYFRSKDKLFEYILKEVIGRISTGIKGMFAQEMSVRERLLTLVDVYISVLLENRYLPLFIMNEISHNPDRFVALLRENVMEHMQGFFIQVQEETEKGLINPVHPLHLLLNILGMVIFPFLVNPVLTKAVGGELEGMPDGFLEERKVVVQEFIINALTPHAT